MEPEDQDFNEGSPYAFRRMCEVCHLRLNRRVSPEGVTVYHHGFHADHEPVPVMEPAQDDVILVCDFCLDRHPTWNFGCENFMDAQSITPDPSQDLAASMGDWAACDACKQLVVAGNWNGLADRSIQGHIRNNPEAAAVYAAAPSVMMMNRMGMMNLHQQFNEARTGPPQPIHRATWIASKLREVVGEQE